MLATVGAYAQGNGIAGITEATNMATSHFDPGTKLIYAVGAVDKGKPIPSIERRRKREFQLLYIP